MWTAEVCVAWSGDVQFTRRSPRTFHGDSEESKAEKMPQCRASGATAELSLSPVAAFAPRG